MEGVEMRSKDLQAEIELRISIGKGDNVKWHQICNVR